MNMRLIATVRLLPFLMLGFLSGNAHGELVINVLDATIGAGQTGTVDVLISNVTPAGGTPTDFQLEFAEFFFDITGGPATSELQFQIPQNPTPEESLPNYLFASDPTGLVQTVTPSAPDQYTGEYIIQDVAFIPVDAGSTSLLVQLDIEHFLGAGQAGDTFPVATFNIDPLDFAIFEDPGLNEIPFNFAASTSGLITVTAVPEPATAVGLIALGGTFFAPRRKRA